MTSCKQIILWVIGTCIFTTCSGDFGGKKHVHFKIHVPFIVQKVHHVKPVFHHIKEYTMTEGPGEHLEWFRGYKGFGFEGTNNQHMGVLGNGLEEGMEEVKSGQKENEGNTGEDQGGIGQESRRINWHGQLLLNSNLQNNAHNFPMYKNNKFNKIPYNIPFPVNQAGVKEFSSSQPFVMNLRGRVPFSQFGKHPKGLKVSYTPRHTVHPKRKPKVEMADIKEWNKRPPKTNVGFSSHPSGQVLTSTQQNTPMLTTGNVQNVGIMEGGNFQGNNIELVAESNANLGNVHPQAFMTLPIGWQSAWWPRDGV